MNGLFEKRRQELIFLLKNRTDEIDLSRQHQIYGAVKEIELFLETIKYFEDISNDDEFDDVILPMPQDKGSFLKRMRDSLIK